MKARSWHAILVAAFVAGCETTEPETAVEVMSDAAVVDVDTKRSTVHVGEQGIQIRTPGTHVDIGGGQGVRVESNRR